MTNRRRFLQIGLATTTSPLAARTANAKSLAAFAFGQAQETIPFYKIIVDERFDESIAFGKAMHQKGFDTCTMANGDLSKFWYEELNAIWEKQPVAIAGLTRFGPLFCLEQLGRTYGARVIYRGEHHYNANGKVTHTLNGPEMLVSRCSDILDFSNPRLAGETAAEFVMGCEAGKTAIVDAEFSEQANHQSPLVDVPAEDSLISWIVAPAQMA